MLTSLFETNKKKQFKIFLLTDCLTKSGRDKIADHCQTYDNRLEIIDCNLYDLGLGSLNYSNWHLIIYLKLFILELLPDSIDRCLFLDVDIIINQDITELYEFDLQKAIIGAYEDTPVSERKRNNLGLDLDDTFINSGVMVIDLEEWRQSQLEKVSSFLKNNINILSNDQDAIALFFKGRIKLLNTNKWNVTTFYFHQSPIVPPNFNEDINEIRKEPWIIHFSFPVKPWYKECKHPFKKLYDKYLDLTPYQGFSKPHYFYI